MIASAFAACGSAISAAVSWLNRFTDALPGSEVVIIVGFFIFTSGRLLLRPIVGAGSSDTVKRPSEEEE